VRHTGDTPRSINLQIATNIGGAWLSVTPQTGTTPVRLNVTANPTGLPAGTYTGTIFISSTGIATARVDVSLVVVSGSQLTASPAGLAFQRQAGVTVAPESEEQFIAVNATGGTATVTATVATNDNGSWLQATQTVSTPGSIGVRVNSAGLAAGNYNGTVTLSSPNTATLVVPVTLVVSTNPILSSTPTALTFAVRQGGQPVTQQVPLRTSNNTSVTFTANATMTGAGTWLVATPLVGTAPGNLDVSVNPVGLATGTYTGSITLNAPASAQQTLTIPVTLTVTDSPALLALPTSLSVDVTTDGTQAGAVRELSPIAVSSTPAGTSFTVTTTTQTGGAWLVAGPGSGATTSNVTSVVDATGLSPGTYRGQISIAGAANVIVVPVTMTVAGAASIVLDPATVTFNLQKNQATPATQLVNVRSTGAAYPYQIAVTAITPAGSTWLNLDSTFGTTPSTLAVGINSPVANALPNGQYSATVSFLAQQGVTPALSGSPSFNVVLNVSDTPLFNVSPATIDFVVPLNGNAPTARLLAITATDSSSRAFTVNATTTSGGNWLLVGPTAGSTPANLTIQPLPFGLGVGTYEGTIAVTVPSISTTPVNVRVRLIIQPNTTLSANPGTLAFTQAAGGGSPAPRTIAIATSAGAASFRATTVTTSGGNWLSVTPDSGSAPSTLTVSVNSTGLAAGNYNGSIAVISQDISNSPILIPVTLSIGAPSLAVTPSTVTLTSVPGSTSPVTQQLAVTAGAAGFTVSVATTSGGNWLSATPLTGTSPGTVTLTANPTGLSSGTYTGTVTFSALGVGNSPLVVPVTFTIANIAPTVPDTQVLAQIAEGSGWKTTIILANLDTEAAPFTLRFYGGNGSPLPIPFLANPPLTSGGTADTIEGSIPVGGTRIIETAGGAGNLLQGWAQLSTNRLINGLAIFRQRVTGRPDQEATVTLTVPSSRFTMPFDNTGDLVTTMAIAHTSVTLGTTVTVTIRDESGIVIGTDTISLSGRAQSAFALTERFPVSRARRGTVDFTSTSQITGLGFRFNPTGAFTSIPVLRR